MIDSSDWAQHFVNEVLLAHSHTGTAVTAREISDRLVAAGLLTNRDITAARTWSLPPEPGEEVTAVRDRCGQRWLRGFRPYAPTLWGLDPNSDGSTSLYSWWRLLLRWGPVTDASSEEVPAS